MGKMYKPLMALAILAGAILACSQASPEQIRHYTLTPTDTGTPTPTDTGTPMPVSPTILPVSVTPSLILQTNVTAIRSLNIREKPGTGYKVVGYLYNDESVSLTGKCGDGWTEIETSSGIIGWVNSDYLSGGFCK